jgi:hypothetical protein
MRPPEALAALSQLAATDHHEEPRQYATRELGKAPAPVAGVALSVLIPLLADPVVAGDAATSVKLLLIRYRAEQLDVNQVVLTDALGTARDNGDEHCALQATAALRLIVEG